MILYRSSKQQNIPDNELWLFSKNVYQRAGIAVTCLYLQNNYDLNVNLLLACLWYADSSRGVLLPEDIAALIAELTPWQQKVTEEIRKLRQQLPKQSTNEKLLEIRKLVINTELFSEKIQQSILHDKLSKDPKLNYERKTALDGANNIQNYFIACNLNIDTTVLTYRNTLLKAAFADFNEQDLQ